MNLRMKETPLLNFRMLWMICLILFFAFERVLIAYVPALGNLDEAFAIVIAVEIILDWIHGNRKLAGVEIVMLILMIFTIIIGLTGNAVSGLMKNPFSIVIDIISTYKVFLVFYWVRLQSQDEHWWDELIRTLAGIVRGIVWLLLFTCLFSYAVHGSMLGEVRHGIPSFKFLFNNPGNFSKLFYFIIPLLTADLYYEGSRYKKGMIGLALAIWCTTMRSRAIAFAFCYLLLVVWYFYLKDKQKRKIKIWQLVPFGIIGVCMGWKQIIRYFMSETQARAVLLRYGIATMAKYFPLGSGFGTYGSDVAVKSYSPLYVRYGFQEIYGMGKTHTNFLNDNYWPMIIGQMGAIGTVLIVLVLYLLYRHCLKWVSENRFFHFATLVAMGFLLASSIASKSYSEFSTIPVIMLHGLLVQRERSIHEEI